MVGGSCIVVLSEAVAILGTSIVAISKRNKEFGVTLDQVWVTDVMVMLVVHTVPC